MAGQNSSNYTEPRFGSTIKDDIKHLKIKDDFRGEYKDLKEYFLSEDLKDKAETMGKFKRLFVIPWWLFKSLYFKLTPFRRLLALAGIVFLILSAQTESGSGDVSLNFQIFALLSGLSFLFVIALELKDKLHAKTELEEGRSVQKALTPDALPVVEGWDIWLYTEPANDVGGDLLDYLNITEERVGISVGDVAGKGLSAALLMAKLQSTIRAIIPDYKSLADLGKKINHIFCRDSLPRLFASLVYLELKTGAGKVRILNAGHLPPVILRNGKFERLEITSPALGIIPQAKFKEQSVRLKNNEAIVVYSDGLTEARNEEGEFFGGDRLEKLLTEVVYNTSKDAGEYILNSIMQFTTNAKSHDDLTIAIIKRNESD